MSSSLENDNQETILHPRKVEGVNLSRDSQFFKQDDSVKTKIYSGKTFRSANLSNEYNSMLFLIFRFPKNRPLSRPRVLFSGKQNGQFTKWL